MAEFTTEAELIRRIADRVARELAGGAQPAAKATKTNCGCGCKGQRGFIKIAEENGHCAIFREPDAERTTERGFVPIGISARHLHVTEAQVEQLFGKGHRLTPIKPLLQPGQFAAKETVSVIGPRGRALERVRILGPCRSATQLEVSLTDCIALGIEAPVRPSGNHTETGGILIVGPAGHLPIERGVIRANRHIHLHTREAAALGLKDNDTVMVHIDGDKPVLYYDVQIRVSDSFTAEMHLDTDDANAVGLREGAAARIVRRPEDIVVCGRLA